MTVKVVLLKKVKKLLKCLIIFFIFKFFKIKSSCLNADFLILLKIKLFCFK